MHGKWFCSEKCSLEDPETQKLQEMFEKGINFDNDGIEENADEEDNYANDEDIDL